MSEMASTDASGRRARARRLVESLAEEHGHLGEDVYATMSAETRRRVEEALLKKDEIIGASVITYGAPQPRRNTAKDTC